MVVKNIMGEKDYVGKVEEATVSMGQSCSRYARREMARAQTLLRPDALQID